MLQFSIQIDSKFVCFKKIICLRPKTLIVMNICIKNNDFTITKLSGFEI